MHSNDRRVRRNRMAKIGKFESSRRIGKNVNKSNGTNGHYLRKTIEFLYETDLYENI